MNLGAIGLAGAIFIGSAMGAGAAYAANNGNGNGEGHTPTVVCHWVPGLGQRQEVPGIGGSYIVIVVDDDGADGNGNGRRDAMAHDPNNHENDIINPPNGDCYGQEEED
jgi:hypothetical protein